MVPMGKGADLVVEMGDEGAPASEKDPEASALMSAVKSGNAGRLKELIRGMVEDCMSEGSAGGEEE